MSDLRICPLCRHDHRSAQSAEQGDKIRMLSEQAVLAAIAGSETESTPRVAEPRDTSEGESR